MEVRWTEGLLGWFCPLLHLCCICGCCLVILYKYEVYQLNVLTFSGGDYTPKTRVLGLTIQFCCFTVV